MSLDEIECSTRLFLCFSHLLLISVHLFTVPSEICFAILFCLMSRRHTTPTTASFQLFFLSLNHIKPHDRLWLSSPRFSFCLSSFLLITAFWNSICVLSFLLFFLVSKKQGPPHSPGSQRKSPRISSDSQAPIWSLEKLNHSGWV